MRAVAIPLVFLYAVISSAFQVGVSDSDVAADSTNKAGASLAIAAAKKAVVERARASAEFQKRTQLQAQMTQLMKQVATTKANKEVAEKKAKEARDHQSSLEAAMIAQKSKTATSAKDLAAAQEKMKELTFKMAKVKEVVESSKTTKLAATENVISKSVNAFNQKQRERELAEKRKNEEQKQKEQVEKVLRAKETRRKIMMGVNEKAEPVKVEVILTEEQEAAVEKAMEDADQSFAKQHQGKVDLNLRTTHLYKVDENSEAGKEAAFADIKKMLETEGYIGELVSFAMEGRSKSAWKQLAQVAKEHFRQSKLVLKDADEKAKLSDDVEVQESLVESQMDYHAWQELVERANAETQE